MREETRMKNMMMGLFLMLVSIWFLIFGAADHAALFVWASIILLFPAAGYFLAGFFKKD